MPTRLSRDLRRAILLPHAPERSDAELVKGFWQRRDDAAFETLLRRHGRMVLGVCRRLLGNTPDADDAFQATFLVFVRKAASLRAPEAVGSWLYGVAYRTAPEARGRRARQRAKEQKVLDMAPGSGPLGRNSADNRKSWATPAPAQLGQQRLPGADLCIRARSVEEVLIERLDERDAG